MWHGLTTMNVSGNRLTSLHPVGELTGLRELCADGNQLSQVK